MSVAVRPRGAAQGMLRTALVLVASDSLHVGSAAPVDREELSLPECYIGAIRVQTEGKIEARVPEDERQETEAVFNIESRRAADEFFEHTMKPYERFVPLRAAATDTGSS